MSIPYFVSKSTNLFTYLAPKKFVWNKIHFLLRNEDGDSSTHIIWCIFVQDLTAKYSWGFSSFLVIDIKQIDFCPREKQLKINGLIFALVWNSTLLYFLKIIKDYYLKCRYHQLLLNSFEKLSQEKFNLS